MLKRDERYANLGILRLEDEADAKRLLFLLSDMYSESVSWDELENESYLAREYTPQLPGSLLGGLVLSPMPQGLGAQSAIIELDYIDRDSNVAFSLIHARSFRDHPRRAVRLHFFTKALTYSDFSDERKLQDSYLGFCVLSPARPRTIGRTVLPPPGNVSSVFAPAQSKFSVNVGGAQLYASGTAFIQQDGRVAACASASTWMSTIILAKLWGDMPIRSMAEITQLATRHSLPPSGAGASPGLTVPQILWSLHEMGYEPTVHAVRDPDEAKELIYRYVESGIPPILIVFLPTQQGFHALTVAGHTYDPNLDPTAQIANGSRSTSIWCPYFFIHDDQKGAYLKCKVAVPNPRSEGRPTLLIDSTDPLFQSFKEDILDWYYDASIHYVIAPLPPRHTLRAEQAADKGRAILENAYSLYANSLGITQPVPALYRTYLIASNTLKRRFAPESLAAQVENPDVFLDLATWYRSSIYPRYVWVTELCGLEHRARKLPEHLRIVASVTIDPTSSPYPRDFITLHIPHLFFRMMPKDNNAADVLTHPVAFLENDQPYPPLLRLTRVSDPSDSAKSS